MSWCKYFEKGSKQVQNDVITIYCPNKFQVFLPNISLFVYIW